MEASRLTEWFQRRWVCHLARRGVALEAPCSPDKAHENWKCGWHWEASVPEKVWEGFTGDHG